MIRISLVAAIACFGVAAPTLAQQPSPPPMSRSPAALDRHMANIRHAQQLEYEQFRDEATGNNLTQRLERIDLANRVSGLIQLGKCAEARALANEAGDRLMAVRARQICRQRDEPARR